MLTILPEEEPSNIIIYIGFWSLCVISLSYDREWLPAAILSVYKQCVQSARTRRVIIVRHYLGHIIARAIIILLSSFVTKRMEYTILF